MFQLYQVYVSFLFGIISYRRDEVSTIACYVQCTMSSRFNMFQLYQVYVSFLFGIISYRRDEVSTIACYVQCTMSSRFDKVFSPVAHSLSMRCQERLV